MLLVDPGQELLRSAAATGIDLWVVPNPHAPLPPGLPPDRVFLGSPAMAADGTLRLLLTRLVRR
jgi:hypothetical protein